MADADEAARFEWTATVTVHEDDAAVDARSGPGCSTSLDSDVTRPMPVSPLL
jgi:hypothetical protein